MKKTRYQPNYTIPPGETLNETLETMRMTRAELANRTGRAKKMIDEIIAGKAAITAETALELERVLGICASFWNNLERNCQETKARLKEEEELKKIGKTQTVSGFFKPINKPKATGTGRLYGAAKKENREGR